MCWSAARSGVSCSITDSIELDPDGHGLVRYRVKRRADVSGAV